MLQRVSKYTQGWFATTMGIILSFAFILWGIQNYLQGGGKKNVMAKVNGRQITGSEVDNDFQRMIMRFKEQVGANFILPPIMQQQLKQQALNNLIMQTVLVQAAQKAGFRITNQETSAMIKQMPVFLEDGAFSKERFNYVINKMGYSREEFFSDVAQTLMLNQVASGIIGSAFVLPNELNQAIALLEQKRDIEYTIIAKASLLKNQTIPDSQVTAYYEQHKQQFKIPAKVQVEYLQLSASDMKKNNSVSDKEIDNYFEINADLNKKDPKTIKRAREVLQQQKIEQAFLSASDKLTELTYTNPNSLAEAAKVLGLQVQTSNYFTQDGGTTQLTKNPKVISTAFNTEILKNHSNSSLIELSSGNVVVIRIKNYQSESIAPLKDVQQKIKNLLLEEKAKQQVQQKASSLVNQVSNLEDYKKLLTKEHLTIVAKQQVSRHEKNINPEILNLAFSIAPNAKKTIASAPLANGDFVIVALNKSTDMVADKASSSVREAITKSYSETYGKLEYNLYGENQLEHAKIRLMEKPTTK